ncbi:carbohydrate kinase family protein [Saccharospirillum salsuginis]|uniref:Fructokinase n=1 Tax=Saccharospirillum salsuginis TaxID=418750 RepID=A0A918JYX3_9GAMM|nr:carbohydrate kinase [Saccharospirillum salsuginis]GGX38333.1 fructokinase [Saccharospirillum salsuginis]
MKPIYAFGELLIDALQQGQTTEDGLAIPGARFYPGGAPANAAVAAAKLDVPTFFIGQIGRDAFGAYLKQALNHYGVDTRYLRSTNAPTPMAVVSLDEHGERSFQFYRNGTADVMLPAHKLPHPREFKPGIVHVCSNTLTEEHIRNVHLGFVDRCIDAGNRISFDVNLRRNLWPDQTNFHEPIKQMLTRADVIKVSRDELAELWEVDAEEALTNLVFSHRAQAIYITDGAKPVVLLTREGREEQAAPRVDVVDTTAAGDAFSGAILASLSRDESATPDWKAALSLGVRCGAFAVGRAGAFPSLPVWTDVSE